MTMETYIDRTWTDEGLVTAASCAAFTATYLFLRLAAFPAMSSGFSNRMTSLVHAVLMLFVSAWAIDFDRKWSDFGQQTTAKQARCLSITLGYFIYDTIGVYLIEHDWGNTIHHSASIAALAVGVFQNISGSELVWSLFLMELSNPLLHLQSYFRETSQQNSKIASAVDVLFLLSFLICRVIFGPYIAYRVLICPTSSIVVKAGGLGVQLMSFVWTYKLLKVVKERLSSSKKAKSS